MVVKTQTRKSFMLGASGFAVLTAGLALAVCLEKNYATSIAYLSGAIATALLTAAQASKDQTTIDVSLLANGERRRFLVWHTAWTLLLLLGLGLAYWCAIYGPMGSMRTFWGLLAVLATGLSSLMAFKLSHEHVARLVILSNRGC